MSQPKVNTESNPKTDPTFQDAKKKETGNRCFKWLVLASCFLVNFILEGSFNAFGVIYVDLLGYFGESRSRVAWIGSLYFSLPLIGGALASMIVSKIGCRVGGVLGSLLAAGAVVASSYVKSVDVMCLTFGCVAGLANSLPYIASVLILSQYFDKRLGLANGIAECGAALGTVILPIVFEKLTALFGWRGNILMLGGFLFNMVALSLIFVPSITRTKKDEEIVKRREMENNNSSTGTHVDDTSVTVDGDTETPLDDTLRASHIEHFEGQTNLSSGVVQRIYKEDGSFVKEEMDHCIADDKKAGDPCCKRISMLLRTDIFKNIQYTAYIAVICVMYLWVDVPYVYMSDRAIGLGLGRELAALQLSVMGGLQLAGNLLFGFIGDLEMVDNAVCFGVCVFLSGVALAIVPFFTTFGPLAAAAGMFGFFSAAAESMCSVMLVDFLSVQRLSSGYGYVMVFKGLTELIGPPLAGMLYDISLSYDDTFYVAGGSMAAAGLIYTPIAKCLSIRAKTQNRTVTSSDQILDEEQPGSRDLRVEQRSDRGDQRTKPLQYFSMAWLNTDMLEKY